MSSGELSDLAKLEIQLLSWCCKGFNIPRGEAARAFEAGVPFLEHLRNRRIESLLYIGAEIAPPIQRLYTKVWQHQREALLTFLNEAARVGMRPIVFKGAELFSRYYPGGLCLLNDLDVLVRPDELGRAKKVLYGMDYRQAVVDESVRLVDRDIGEIAEIEGSHYELASFKRLLEISVTDDELSFAKGWQDHPLWVVGDRCYVEIDFDVHHGVAYDVTGEEFFGRAVPSALGVGETMSVADHLWLTTSRFYNEVAAHGKSTLRDFAYAGALLTEPRIDWDVVTGAAEKYENGPTLYYFLYFLKAIGGVVPEAVLRDLDPARCSRACDWGWQLGRLFNTTERFPSNFDEVTAEGRAAAKRPGEA